MHQHAASAKIVESGPASADPRARTPTPASQATLLFTDIEGSTALWEADEARTSQALALHDALARNAVESHGGAVVKTTGDGILAVFDDPGRALAATLELQCALNDPAVGGAAPHRVRFGIHRGLVEHRDGDYWHHRKPRGADHDRGARWPGVAGACSGRQLAR